MGVTHSSDVLRCVAAEPPELASVLGSRVTDVPGERFDGSGAVLRAGEVLPDSINGSCEDILGADSSTVTPCASESSGLAARGLSNAML